MNIPSHIKARIRELGLRSQDETIEILARDDLEHAACAIAATACFNGDRGEWWRLWLDTQDVLGVTRQVSFENLDIKALLWLGNWATKEKRTDIAIAALERYHENAEPSHGYSGHVTTLTGLYLSQGNHAKLLEFCEEVQARTNSPGITEAYRIVALSQLGRGEEAKCALEIALEHFPHCSSLWLVHAVCLAAVGKLSDSSLACCAKSDSLPSRALIEFATHWILNLESRLLELKAFYGPGFYGSDEEQVNAWLSARGARIMPTEHESPHWFGSDFFEMPTCVGCGFLMTLYFVLDPIADRANFGQFVTWLKLPLFSCRWCCMELGRNDFRVDWNKKQIAWLAHELSPETFGRVSSISAPTNQILPKRFVSLNGRLPVSSSEEIPTSEIGDYPQAGGRPDWVQNAERPYCPKCHGEMKFYGAMGSTDDFKPHLLAVNNQSGYLYHFACNECFVISVLSQCT